MAPTHNAAEYGAHVLCNDAHIKKKVDTQLHTVIRVISSGAVKSTQLHSGYPYNSVADRLGDVPTHRLRNQGSRLGRPNKFKV